MKYEIIIYGPHGNLKLKSGRPIRAQRS